MELPGEDRGGDPSPRPGMRERERERKESSAVLYGANFFYYKLCGSVNNSSLGYALSQFLLM